MRSVSGLVATAALVLALAGRGAADNRQGYRADLARLAKQNADFRRVLFTADHVQIVAMSLPPNEDIGPEVHRVDHCFFFVEGGGTTMVDGRVTAVKEDDVLCVPAGLRHNVRNPGPVPLKLYTIYSPALLPPGTVHHTKQDALETAQTRQAARPAVEPAAGPSPGRPSPATSPPR